jgi:acetyl-CoA C-acetyltransferase
MRQPVYVIDGSRTPFIKARGKPGPFTPVDLAVQCGRPLLLRQPFAPDAFDQVILGCVNVIADEMNPARVAALRLGMGETMVAFTVQINCGSGMQSIDTAYRYIQNGSADLILAGGAESLSHAPLVFNRKAVNWYAALFSARSFGAKLAAFAGFRPSMLTPVIGLERGLTDPITELNMGQTAELVAHLFHVTRRQADEYAAESQQRLAKAQSEGWLKDEIEPAFARDGTAFDHDDGVRPDSTADALAKLKPAFERPWGKVTPGNSSQITDGASWEDAEFCRNALGIDGPAGRIPRDRLNVDGGAIGTGHPVGASGNRIVLHLVNAMKRLGLKRGIATECIGGGQGGAMLIEAI